jgi:pyruvate dehydrogenase E1 component alpha subunit
MGTSSDKTSAIVEQYKKAASYAMPGEPVDGMDVLAVYQATKRAVEHIRTKQQPFLLEMRSYRYRGHSVIDPARYRSEADVKAWASSDPLIRFRTQLLDAGVLTEAAVKAAEAEVEAVVEAAVMFADESPFPDVSTLFDNLYYEPEGK